MRSFKKAVCRTAVFVLIFSLVCSPVVIFYAKHGSTNNDYLPELDAEKGKIDLVFCGASQSVWGFIPEVMDAVYGCNSFNVASGLLSMEGRYTILSNVIRDNPVKTVVMDLSFNWINRDEEKENVEGDLLLEEHLHGAERVGYFFRHVRVNELFPAFYYVFRTGLYGLADHVFHLRDTTVPDYKGKGYPGDVNPPKDMRGVIHWLDEDYGKTDEPEEPKTVSEEHRMYIDKIMQLCEDNGINVVFVTTAYPDSVVSWTNRDLVLDAHLDLARQYGCTLYDFNLLRDKDAYFSDETSYADSEHVVTEGALAETKLLGEWMRTNEPGVGESPLFYGSYAEMIQDYLQKNAPDA